jgi:hypothetical protein
MSRDYLYGVTRWNGPKPSGKGPPPHFHGKAVRGRIMTLLVGQGHGFIRLGLPSSRRMNRGCRSRAARGPFNAETMKPVPKKPTCSSLSRPGDLERKHHSQDNGHWPAVQNHG